MVLDLEGWVSGLIAVRWEGWRVLLISSFLIALGDGCVFWSVLEVSVNCGFFYCSIGHGVGDGFRGFPDPCADVVSNF